MGDDMWLDPVKPMEDIEELVDAYCGNEPTDEDFGVASRRYAGNLLQRKDSCWDADRRTTIIEIHGRWHIVAGEVVVNPTDFTPVLIVGPWEVSLDYLSDGLQEELKNNAKR
jgi:hypothetical protein